jgi:nitronate monooxygenase
MAWRTALTRRLGLYYPIIGAPLGRGSTPEFLAALAREGAMGFVALAHMPETTVRQTLSSFVAATGGPDRFGVNLVLIIDQMRRLDAALDAGCRVVSLLRGDPAPYVRRAKEAGATVFWTAKNPSDAQRAADLGVDFIIAQGREAGGHLTGEAPLMALLPAIVDAVRNTPVVAAGGIADGRGLAAAVALGACGVCMGTRFIASAESGSHRGHKQKVVDAGFADLVVTTLFDGGWPDSPHRVIRNSTYELWRAADSPPSGSRPGEGERIGTFPEGPPMLRYNVSTPWEGMEGDWEAAPLYAGTSAALVSTIEPISVILTRTASEAERILSGLAADGASDGDIA